MIRITLGLLQFFEKEMISKDIVELSILMKSIRTNWLQTAKEREQLFALILNVKGVRICL